jgi:formimidoylglutamate deiminase
MPIPTLYLPEMLYVAGHAVSGVGLLVDAAGLVAGVMAEDAVPPGTRVVRLAGKALLPGLANAHSHTFQRLFRGRAEGRAAGPYSGGDTFWTWREQMYGAAGFVSPEDLYDVARATFLEMVAAGITVVGEFHYVHRDRDGRAYPEPNLLSEQVIAAARSVGMRICLLRTGYFRAGFERAPHEGQRRFYELPDEYLHNLEELAGRYAGVECVSVGAAPHSIRAVPLADLERIVAFARARRMPLHMHISEQVGENAACVAEYGATPVALLASHELLDAATTLIHAIHLIEQEFAAVAAAGTTICSCPTTERNLGDGIFPADVAARLGIPVAFGTDSQAQIDILEDARQLEYHLRLRDQLRGILDASARAGREGWVSQEAIGEGLFRAASVNGYAALGLAGGRLAVGEPADFFTVDWNDLSMLGVDAESLVAQAVFSLAKGAVRDVAVQGRMILEDGLHRDGDSIRERYRVVQERFRSGSVG